tara:strand:- start:392 stop:985 length:594 start_codon:yes stop_codon:yes gene_type:complete
MLHFSLGRFKMKKFHAFMLFAIVFTAVNSMLLQQWKIGYLNNQLTLSEMRGNINTEWTNELLWSRINDVHDLTKDQLVGQGRIEGVVSYLSGENQEMIDNLWHEGYMRGLAQTDYEYEVISDSNYEKGYHAAMQDAFPVTHPNVSFGFVNETPRNIPAEAIKTPEFDENNQDLEDNDEVINNLNNKIEEVDPRNKQE